MVFDGLRAYLQLANGLTDVTKARAMATARALVQQGEAGVATVVPEQLIGQVGTIAEDILATSRANRDLLVGLVRVEVERSVSRLGLVSATELKAASARAQLLLDRVQELERSLRVAQDRAAQDRAAQDRGARGSGAAAAAAGADAPAATPTTVTPAKKSTASKAAPRKASARKAPASKAPASKATTSKPTASKTTASKTTASKTTASKTSASKTTARKVADAPATKTAATKRATRTRKATA